MPVILGIDPGSRITGFGVITGSKGRYQYITSGCIKLTGETLPDRLWQIQQGVDQLITEFKPEEFAIEQVFLGKNADSAIKLGQARGVAIVAAAMHQLPVFEYAARSVKQAVTGQGGASKELVQQMIQASFKLPGKPQADAADALAIALCHGQTNQQLLAKAGGSTTRRGRIR